MNNYNVRSKNKRVPVTLRNIHKTSQIHSKMIRVFNNQACNKWQTTTSHKATSKVKEAMAKRAIIMVEEVSIIRSSIGTNKANSRIISINPMKDSVDLATMER